MEWRCSFLYPKDVPIHHFAFSTEKHLTVEGLNNCSSRLYPPFTTFVTCRGTVGNLAMAGIIYGDESVLLCVEGKETTFRHYLYFLSRYVIATMKEKASGAVFSALVTRDLKWKKCLSLILMMQTFSKSVLSHFAQILANTNEIQQLSDLQNALLAQLSSC